MQEACNTILSVWANSKLAKELTRYAFNPSATKLFSPFFVKPSQPILGDWWEGIVDHILPHTKGPEMNVLFYVASFDQWIRFNCKDCQNQLEEEDFFFTNCAPMWLEAPSKVTEGFRMKDPRWSKAAIPLIPSFNLYHKYLGQKIGRSLAKVHPIWL